MLLAMQKAGADGITKQVLTERVGVCGQSIDHWRKAYREGGLEQLLSHKKSGSKPSVFTEKEKQCLQKLVGNPQNGIVGYKELQGWVLQNFGKSVKYITLNKFMRRTFKTKIKAARKSHVKKAPQQVDAFKKLWFDLRK
jgi:transposase